MAGGPTLRLGQAAGELMVVVVEAVSPAVAREQLDQMEQNLALRLVQRRAKSGQAPAVLQRNQNCPLAVVEEGKMMEGRY